MAKEAVLSAKYTSYPKYNNTGVSWLPDMPQGWRVTKLKFLVRALESGVSVNAADYPKSEGEFGVLKTSCVYTREFRAEENKTVFEEEITRVKCPVKADSIIISRMNTPALVGAAAYVDADYKDLYLPDRLWQTVYNDEKVQSSKYLHYFMYLRGFRDEISNYAEGASSSMQNIAKEDFLSINLLLPSREEQQKIANFLDHETAKIDTLIDKQQQLIALLKEKRQAVISHAVTKGLPSVTGSKAPMRDSGVEWLGEVPAHWTLSKIKYVAELTPKKSQVEKVKSSKCSFVPMEKLKTDQLILDEFRTVGDVIEGYTYFENEDVLMAKVTPCFENKNMVVARGLENGIGFGSSEIYVLRANSKILNDFLYYRLQEGVFMGIATASMSGAGGLKRVPSDIINNFIFSIPPKQEQGDIFQHICAYTSKFDDLIEKAVSAIALMQERRTALISAAVTGKIDVRNWQAPATTNNKEVAT